MNTHVKKFTQFIAALALLIAVSHAAAVSAKATPYGSGSLFFHTSELFSEDGKAYVITHQGDCHSLPHKQQDIAAAYMTPDDRLIVVLLNNGQLYITNGEAKRKEVLCSNADEVVCFRNEGLVYRDRQGGLYRVIFGANMPLFLGSDGDRIACADHCLTLLLLSQNKVCTLEFVDTQPRPIADAPKDNQWNPLGVSDDGLMAIWEDVERKQIFAVNGSTLLKPIHAGNSVFVVFSADQNIASIFDIGGESIGFLHHEKGLREYKLNAPLARLPYTSKASMFSSTYETGEDLYINTYGNPGPFGMLHISYNGIQTDILTDMTSCIVSGKRIFYTDALQKLYTAELSGPKLKEVSEVGTLSQYLQYTPSSDGKYVYYLLPSGEDNVLICYNTKTKQKQIVAEKVGEDLNLYQDGLGILFYKDIEYLTWEEKGSDDSTSLTLIPMGTLMLWHPGDSSSQEIDTRVVCNSENDFTIHSQPQIFGFYYDKYSHSGEDGHYFVDLSFYDGQIAALVVPNVVR